MTSRAGRAVVPAFVAFLVASALHFADNAIRFDRYHDAATHWLTPTIVAIAWFVQTALGVGALALHRRGRRLGRPLLVVYAVLGFAGFLHYAAGMPHADAGMHALIAFEAAAGLTLLVVVLRDGWSKGRPTASP
jgi:drug/metabolite transporter (DMT)-like permease